MEKRFLIFIFLGIIVFSQQGFGGKNSGAKALLDLNTKNDSIDSIGVCRKDSTFTVGIYLNTITEMFAVEADIEYDTSILQYMSMVTETEKFPNMLKSKGASITPAESNYQGRKNTKAIAVSILGMVQSQCASGSGYIGFLTFKKLKENTTSLNLFRTVIIDYDEGEDILNNCSVGTIYVEISSVKKTVMKNSVGHYNPASLEIVPVHNVGDNSIIVNLMGRKYSTQVINFNTMIKHQKRAYSPRIIVNKETR